MDTIREELVFITKRNELFEQLEQLAKQNNFIRVESDYFEDFVEYMNQNTRQSPRSLVKVQDLRGNVLLLQPDITTNIIKQVIPRMESDFQAKLYYLDNVFGYDEQGAITKTRQFGVEVIGDDTIQADIDLIKMAVDIFTQNNINVSIEIGNQRWVEQVIQEMNITPQQASLVRDALIAKNKDQLKRLLRGNPYLPLVLSTIESQHDIVRYKAIINKNNLATSLLVELDKLESMNDKLDSPSVVFDLSLLNPFDYYNGPIFRGYIQGYNKDIVRGGRYDYLTKEFGGLTPALGFSIDVDRLVEEVYDNE